MSAPMELDSPARARFLECLARPEVPLDEAALAIAEEEYRDLDRAAALAELDRLGARVVAVAAGARSPARLLEALREVLAREEKFRGNEEDYYDPRNSYLNEVLARRLGIPISLSVVWMEVARRAGLRLEGVAFPGHFLLKYAAGPGPEIFIDAHNGGEMLGAEECLARFRALAPNREIDPRHLAAVSARQILARMLHNLKRIYVERGEDLRAWWVIDRLVTLQPESSDELRDRGLVAVRIGAAAAARHDLEAWLERHPGAPEADQVREVLTSLRRDRGRMMN